MNQEKECQSSVVSGQLVGPAKAGTPNWPTLPEQVKRFRLGVYCSDYEQPISLMRVMGPFGAMAREDRRLELVLPPMVLDTGDGVRLAKRLNWDWLIQCDAVFFMHPETDVHVHCLSLAWQMGIPIWSEFVDDVFNVDKDNPGILGRSNKRRLAENIASIASWSTCVTCVSEYNREAIIAELAKHSAAGDGRTPDERKFLVIPEGAMWPMREEPRNKCVSWRGLGSHGQDMQEALPQILEVAKAFPDWEWMFAGDQTILEEVGRALSAVIGPDKVWLAPYWPTPFEAMQAWAGRAPYLHIVPLADTTFNRSKSHLAWLEASAVGAAVIAPDHLPEWDQPGVIKYRHGMIETGCRSNGETVTGTLAEVMKREMARYAGGAMHANVHASRSAIWPERTLFAMNRRRWSILAKLAQLATGGSSKHQHPSSRE